MKVDDDDDGSPPSAPSTWSPPRLLLPDAMRVATLEESTGSLSTLIESNTLMNDFKEDGQLDLPILNTPKPNLLAAGRVIKQAQESKQKPDQNADYTTRLRRRSTYLDMLDAVMSLGDSIPQEAFTDSRDNSITPPFVPGNGVSLRAKTHDLHTKSKSSTPTKAAAKLLLEKPTPRSTSYKIKEMLTRGAPKVGGGRQT